MTWSSMSGDPSSDEKVLRDAQKTIERIVDAARSTLDDDVDGLRPEYEKLFGRNSAQFAMYQTLVSTFFQDHRMLTAVSKQLSQAEFVPSNEPKRVSLMEIIANRFSQTVASRENARTAAEAKASHSPDWPNVQPVQAGAPEWPSVEAVLPRAPQDQQLQQGQWPESPQVPQSSSSPDWSNKPSNSWQASEAPKPNPSWQGGETPNKDTAGWQTAESPAKPNAGWKTGEPPNPWQPSEPAKASAAWQPEPVKPSTGWQPGQPNPLPAAGWQSGEPPKTTEAWSNSQSPAAQNQQDWQSKSQQASSGGWANAEVQPSETLNPPAKTGDWINKDASSSSRPPSNAWPTSAEDQAGTWSLKPGSEPGKPTVEAAWPPPSTNQGWPDYSNQPKETHSQSTWGASAWPTQPVPAPEPMQAKPPDSAWPVQPVPPPSQQSPTGWSNAPAEPKWPPPESSGQGKWATNPSLSNGNKDLPAAAWPATNSGGKAPVQKMSNGVIRPSWTAPIGETGQSGTWTLDREAERIKQDSLLRSDSPQAFPPSPGPVPPMVEQPRPTQNQVNSSPTMELPKPAWNSQQSADSAPWVPSPSGDTVATEPAGWSPPRAEPAWPANPEPRQEVTAEPPINWPSPPSQSGPTWTAPPAELTSPQPPANSSWTTPPVTPQGGGFSNPISTANPSIQPWSPATPATPPKTPLPAAEAQGWTPQLPPSNVWSSNDNDNGRKPEVAPQPAPSSSGVVHYQSQEQPPFPPTIPAPTPNYNQNLPTQQTPYQTRPAQDPSFEQPVQTNAAGVVQPAQYQNPTQSPTQYPANPDMPPPPPPRATGDGNQPAAPGTLSGVLKQMRSFDNTRRRSDDDDGSKYDPNKAW